MPVALRGAAFSVFTPPSAEANKTKRRTPEKNQPEGWKLPKAAAITQRKARLIRWKWAKPKEPRKVEALGMPQTLEIETGTRRATVDAPAA